MNQHCLRARQLLPGRRRQAPGLTDAQIGAIFGISRARAYQVRLNALAKLRRAILRDPELRQLVMEVCGLDPGEP